MWKGEMVSVVVTSYREKGSIRAAIEGFFSVPSVDEVVVVDNNAETGSVEEVKKTKARLVFEKQQGHGWALQRGFREAKGEYIVIVEGDGTFSAGDIEKLLQYGEIQSVVFGTRTNKGTMERGALGNGTWGALRRWADILEAQIIEILFSTNRLTDVGCTYSLLRKDVVAVLENRWIKGGSHFVTEIRLQAAAAKIPFVEIPVIFKNRTIGSSYVVGTRWKLTKEGAKMLMFIITFWLRAKVFSRKRYRPINLAKS